MIEVSPEVDYKISLYPSKFVGYQSKNKNKGKITIYISSIWEWVHSNSDNITFERFLREMIYITIIERICLERAFQKIRMKKRCEEYNGFSCKMEYIAMLIAKNMS